MSESLEKSLSSYYCDALLNSYIYSNKLSELLDQNNILNAEWFLDCMEFNVDFNKKYEVYGEQERKNCYEMISRVLYKAIEDNDVEKVEKCNNITRTLNSSGKDNYYEYLIATFIYASANSRRAAKLIDSNYVDFNLFGDFLNTLANVAAYLATEDIERVPKILVLDEFAIHALVDISKRIPDVFNDSTVVQKMFNLLIVNKYVIYNDKNKKRETILNKENTSTFKYLKKTYKRSLK